LAIEERFEVQQVMSLSLLPEETRRDTPQPVPAPRRDDRAIPDLSYEDGLLRSREISARYEEIRSNPREGWILV
jgi:hypothetical protein